MFPSLKRNCLALAVIALIPSVGFSAEMTTKMSGFLDPQLQWSNNNHSPGFVLNDAALYWTATMGSVEAMIDLPFYANNSASQNLTIGTSKAQAYFEYKHDSCKWRLGQFDTFFGNEANDTADLPLTTQGVIHGALTPLVHTGFMYSHNFNNQVTLNAVIADPVGTSKLNGANLYYGAQLGLNMVQNFHFDVGFSLQKPNTETQTLIEIMAGYKADSFSLDAGLDMYKQAAAGAETTMGIFAELGMKMNDDWSGALRFENVSKGTGVLTNDSTMQISVGPEYALAKNLKMKFDYTFNSTKATAATTDSVKAHGVAIAGVVKF